MRSTGRSLLFFLLAATIGLTACGDGDAPADAASAAAAPVDSRRAVPPERMYGATAIENLRVLRVELELRGIPRGWDGMRIAVLSDLLLGLWPDNARVAEAAVRRAVELEPDLVVLLGDYLEGGDADALDRVLAPLRGLPTLGLLGDRDLLDPERAATVVARLETNGVTVLRNRAVAFARGADTAFVVGIEPDFAAFTAAQQAQLFEGLPEGATTPLLISHLPSVLPRLAERRFAAVLAGGTFCGDIEMPGSPRLTSLQQETLDAARIPRTERLFRSSGNTMFVTCGLGYSFVPVRFGAPPEVALVTLLRIPEPRADAEQDTLPAGSP